MSNEQISQINSRILFGVAPFITAKMALTICRLKMANFENPKAATLNHIQITTIKTNKNNRLDLSERLTLIGTKPKNALILSLRYRKAGREWCGGARETREPPVTIESLQSKWSIFANLPAFLDLNGSFSPYML